MKKISKEQAAFFNAGFFSGYMAALIGFMPRSLLDNSTLQRLFKNAEQISEAFKEGSFRDTRTIPKR